MFYYILIPKDTIETKKKPEIGTNTQDLIELECWMLAQRECLEGGRRRSESVHTFIKLFISVVMEKTYM